MSFRFIEFLNEHFSTDALSDPLCRQGVFELIGDLVHEVRGQDAVARRIVQIAILNKHALLEGPPGEGKTSMVMAFSSRVGFQWRRIQFTPDMIASDLTGANFLDLVNGQPRLQWRPGPLYSNVVICDEINRAPGKVQSAALEAMQERKITRIDTEERRVVYSTQCRADLAQHPHARCFGLTVAGVDDDRRAPYIMTATQNPLEMEGTFPLPEAQTDRFTNKLLVAPVDIGWYEEIVRRRLLDNTPVQPPAAKAPIPLWIQSALFFESLRNRLIDGQNGYVNRLLKDRRGLWDRIRLFIRLTHDRHGETALGPGEGIAVAHNPQQQEIEMLMTRWQGSNVRTELFRQVEQVRIHPIFSYLEGGSSPRGLIDWIMMAAVEAFFQGDPVIRRQHLRDTAHDVLRHRIRLTPHARAEQRQTTEVIDALLQALLPRSRPGADPKAEDEEDREAFLPEIHQGAAHA